MSTPKNFLLNFVEENIEINFDQEWSWQPKNKVPELDIKSATFSGKNKADDYTNE